MAPEYVVLILAMLVWGSVHSTVKFGFAELRSLQLAVSRPVFVAPFWSWLALALTQACSSWFSPALLTPPS